MTAGQWVIRVTDTSDPSPVDAAERVRLVLQREGFTVRAVRRPWWSRR